MQESVQLDLIGEMHLDFEEERFVFVRTGYSRLRLPTRVKGCHLAVNTPIFYHDVRWIGCLVQRQWWLLFPGLFFTLFGPIWMGMYLGNWGPFVVSVAWFVILGIIPLILLAKGRPHLGIASVDKIVVLPMDRHHKKIARILGLLRQFCQFANTEWQLEGTSFESADSFDSRPATGKGFDQKRYVRITTLAGLYGVANLLAQLPRFRSLGVILILVVAAAALLWAIEALWRRCKG